MVTCRALVWFALVLPACCLGQEPSPAEEDPVFGTTVVLPFGLRGEIYGLKQWSKHVPNPDKLEHLGTIYTTALNVKAREFTQGFPGVTTRMEWFAIDYTGKFYIDQPGAYEFMLTSDDGSKLFIDGAQVINNDGMHPPVTRVGTTMLAGGIHRLRVPYFQGPRFHLALQLFVRGPGQDDWRVFSTNDFKPPPHPEDWKYGSPDDLTREPPQSKSFGTKLKDIFR